MNGIVVVLVLGVLISVLVGQVLQRVGRPFLDDVFHDERIAKAIADLLAVMFYLLALGTVAVIAVIPMPAMSLLSASALKLAGVLVVLGATHLLVVGVLLQVKRHRRRQILEEEMAERLRHDPDNRPVPRWRRLHPQRRETSGET